MSYRGLAVLHIRDGRDQVHARAIDSALTMVPEPEHHITVDDADHRLGFAGAIRKGWAEVAATDAEWVLHHELDFTFNRPVPVASMIAVLEAHPYLAQIVLKRQPVNRAELEAGGIVEQWPDEYRQRTWRGNVWAEHRLFWSTNPAVYPAAWCRQEWPSVAGSEARWSDRLTADADLRFAFWGGVFDAPAVTHIGERSADGTGY